MSSALENEDLENVALVRMEDVQPSRDRIDRALSTQSPPSNEEVFGICVIDKTEYDDYTLGDDSDSNIGSMVSIKSEEVAEDGAEYTTRELIVPEVLDAPQTIKQEKTEVEQTRPETWPTLEILPGGVIKNAIDWDSESTECPSEIPTTKPSQEEMSYACAKCSETFKHLFCLVKHVKLHEVQEKCKNDPMMLRNHPCSLALELSGTCSCLQADLAKRHQKLPSDNVASTKKIPMRTYKNKRKLLKRLKSDVI